MRDLLARIFSRSENFVAGRYWILETLFLAVLFTVLFSGGVDERLSIASGNYWFPAYFQKIEHPLLDVAKTNPAYNHEAKLNFRLTVPVILHMLHVPTDQRWILPMLAAGGTIALIFLSCMHAFRATGDRVCGLYAALAVSATYIGSFGFAMYYDSIALGQIVLAMLPGMPWPAKGLLVFTASFTDERAWFASFFLLAQTLCMPPDSRSWRERILSADFLSVCGGLAAYVAGRLALEKFAGLGSPHEGIGFHMLLGNFPFWHAGVWLALKGGWLLLVVAAICLWQRRLYAALAFFTLCVVGVVSAGFLVEDVVRSTAYVFPAFLLALGVAGACENLRSMRIYCLAAFVISALAGNYNVWRSQITWFQPVAARMLNHLLHVISGTPIPGA
jgi:hypothetical protein